MNSELSLRLAALSRLKNWVCPSILSIAGIDRRYKFMSFSKIFNEKWTQLVPDLNLACWFQFPCQQLLHHPLHPSPLAYQTSSHSLVVKIVGYSLGFSEGGWKGYKFKPHRIYFHDDALSTHCHRRMSWIKLQ